VRVTGAEVPPPGVGVRMVTEAVPGEVMSAPVIAACRLVLETNVVVRGLPFHFTTDVETKFEPVSVSVKAGEPATNALGAIDASAGAGLSMVKVSGLDVPPPGAGVDTATEAVPPMAMSAAVIAACRLVAETNVVGRALLFHSTVEDEMKFEPVMVSVKAGAPAMALLGARVLTDGAGLGGLEEPPEPPPHPASEARQATVARTAVILATLRTKLGEGPSRIDFRNCKQRANADSLTRGALGFIPAPQNGLGVRGNGDFKKADCIGRSGEKP